MYIFGIHQIIYTALTNNRKNIVTENLKNLKILPFYRLCTKAWPKTRKLWVNPKNCDRRKKASSIRFTKHCVKSVQIQSFFWSVFSCMRTELGDLRNKYVFSRNNGKCGPEKTPYLNAFHPVKVNVVTLLNMSNITWYFNTSLPGSRRFCQTRVWSALRKEPHRTFSFSIHYIFINLTLEFHSQQGNTVNIHKK